MKKIYFAFLVSLGLVSCSSESGIHGERETTFALYKLIYQASGNTTRAQAEFYEFNENGRKLNLQRSASAEVRFKNSTQDVKFNDNSLYFYRDFKGKEIGVSVYFEYVAKTQAYVNTLSLPTSIGIGTSFNSFVKANGATVPFTGAVAANEKVVLKIADATFENATLGSAEFVLSAQDVAAVPVGNVPVSVTRIKRVAAAEATPAGGILQTEYHSGDKIITVQ
ncbi:MAG: hypothetical protein KF872_02465 [Chitinophagales bacterium]|nr:hypothetical protein [Chitinophagales bacterium]